MPGAVPPGIAGPMKVLLINANRLKAPWPVIPFGLCCVAAALENVGHVVEVLDLCFSKSPEADLTAALDGFRPGLIGVSIRNIDNSAGYNTEFLLGQTRDEVVAPLKRRFPGPIVIGGPAVGISGAEMLDFLDLDFAIRGDGEVAMVEFANRVERKLPTDDIAGLLRRSTAGAGHCGPVHDCDLDSLPMPKPHSYVDILKYRRYGSPLQIQTKRGCALKCTYCTYNHIEGFAYRLRDPQRIADEIEYLVRKTGIDHIEFTDSTFNIPLGHAKSVLRAIADKKMDIRLRTMGLNPGAVDEELADLMEATGFRDVDLGAEAGCDAMLRSLGKHYSTDDIVRAAQILQERNIAIAWYLLVGAPGETEETLKETFDTISRAASSWDLINIGVGIRVYQGSPLADRMLREDPSCTDDNFLHPVNYSPEGLDLEEVKRITKQRALSETNFFMYDEDESAPPLVLAFATSLLKLFAPRQPIWRFVIIQRTLQKYLGILPLKRLWHRHRSARAAVSPGSASHAALRGE
jgi:radical SAM superfamily enzyme YgiQ (UPF0313 family)